MGKLLTLIALITSINFCYGQSNTATGWITIDSSDTVPNGGLIMTYDEYRNIKIDTAGCFILYSDKKVVNSTVHSIFAYEVFGRYLTCCDINLYYYTAKDYIKYLDQNKKEFPESIIIWKSIKE